jgi:HSP20 family protein
MARRELDEWFWQVGSELQRLSEELYRSAPTMISRRFWEPKVDVIEDSSGFVLKAEIAGIRGEDIQLVYIAERHSILLRGVRREEDFPDSSRTGIYQLEIYYGEFEREIKLPEIAVEPDGIKAHYRNGFLMIIVPKSAEVKKQENLKNHI